MWLFTFTCSCILAYCVVYSRDVYNFCVPSVHCSLISVHRSLISASIFAKLQWASQAGVPVHLLILLFFIHGFPVQKQQKKARISSEKVRFLYRCQHQGTTDLFPVQKQHKKGSNIPGKSKMYHCQH